MKASSDIRKQLNSLFAYKAEWLKEEIFELFSEPKYFPAIYTADPCVLIGGRGTGKTTVLRGLSYEGQYALQKHNSDAIPKWTLYGFYHRIDTNRVTAFQGPELSDVRWQKLFGHYINLLLSDLVLEFLEWYSNTCSCSVEFDSNTCQLLSTSLCIKPQISLTGVRKELASALVQFESYINNIADEPSIKISLQGAPLDLLIKTLTQHQEFKGKRFCFLIDEYENLDDRQQQVVNTLIKHASDKYTFKIGVRELGWRCRTTLNPNEQLISPADYRLINISHELSGTAFTEFAESVCNERLARLRIENPNIPENIADLFPGLSVEEEAKKLGVREEVDSIERELKPLLNHEEMLFFVEMTDLEKYFLKYWAKGHNKTIFDVYREAIGNKSAWNTRFGNHSYSLLFTLRRNKRGVRKHYCGWQVFTLIASTNIRYLLELVDTSLIAHLKNGENLEQPVKPETQTISAQNVGKKNLGELEGLSTHGARLKKLLLGLGRVFGIMASDAEGHAPEVNQFQLVDELIDPEVNELLRAAVMHLALVRYEGTKPASEHDTKEYDYAIHPIYSPFFVYSCRRKRKIQLSSTNILELVNSYKKGITNILTHHKRSMNDSLPEQLTFFEKYYTSDS